MASYKPVRGIDELVALKPPGTTHINYTPMAYDYLIIKDGYYKVWLGKKHGGWSRKQTTPHPSKDTIIAL